MTLSAIDIAVVAVYFTVVLVVGTISGRQAGGISSSEFFSCGRRLSPLFGAVSSFMSLISCFTLVAYAQIGYEDGLVGVTVFWSSAFAVLVGSALFARRWYRSGMRTPVEYLEERYGAGVRQVSAWCGISFRVLNNAVRLYALGVLVSACAGVSLAGGIWLGAAVSLVCAACGGMRSVVVTGVLQGVVLLLVLVAVLPVSLHAAGGLGVLREALPGHFSFFGGHRGSALFLLAYYLVVFVKYNGEWSFVQRLVSARSESAALKSGLISAVLFLVFPFFVVLPAIAARVVLPDLPSELHERSYIELCIRTLPQGVLGLFMAALFSSTLSVLSSEFNVMANVLTTDVYRRMLRKNASDYEILVVARCGTVALAFVIGVGALAVSGFGGAFETNKVVSALFGVPLAVPAVFGILWRRPNAAGFFLSLSMGVAAGLAFMVLAPSVSWEAATLAQAAVTFAAYFLGMLFRDSARESSSKSRLFIRLESDE